MQLMNGLVKLTRRVNGEKKEISLSALTKKILDKTLNEEVSLEDPITALTIQEGGNLLNILSTRSKYLEAILDLQEEITEDLLLIYKIGILTGAALHNQENALELEILKQSEEYNEPDPQQDND